MRDGQVGGGKDFLAQAQEHLATPPTDPAANPLLPPASGSAAPLDAPAPPPSGSAAPLDAPAPPPSGSAAPLDAPAPPPSGSATPLDAPAPAPSGSAAPLPAALGAPGLAAGDELARQEAFDVAWRFLGHRDRTEAEVRQQFVKKRTDPALVEEVIAALLEGGYLDDASFARRFAEDRRRLDGWGAERIERRLRELGVDRAHIQAAIATDDGHDELAAACALLARRFPIPPATPRDAERALGFLVRKGYDLELAYDALRRHADLTIER